MRMSTGLSSTFTHQNRQFLHRPLPGGCLTDLPDPEHLRLIGRERQIDDDAARIRQERSADVREHTA